MNVEIGTEAAQFRKKEYINGIFFAVYTYYTLHLHHRHCLPPFTVFFHFQDLGTLTLRIQTTFFREDMYNLIFWSLKVLSSERDQVEIRLIR